MTTKTDIVREEIAKFLKMQGVGVKVRQNELTKYLKDNIAFEVTDGIVRGIYNKMAGIGGIYKPIQNVKIAKEDNKVFYYYEPTNFSEDSVVMGKLKQITIEFENNLKNSGLWNVAILDLPFEERKPYLEYMKQFEELRNMVLTAED